MKQEKKIDLQYVDINIFEKNIYQYYLENFPKEEERKTLEEFENAYNNGYVKFIQILNNSQLIGFMILNIKDNGYMILDYLAILPQYRNKGYGTEAVKRLIKLSSKNKGIIIECEKISKKRDDKENTLKIKREKFYEKLGFKKMNFDLLLWNILYTPYVFSNDYINEDLVVNEMLAMYKLIYGKELVNQNCRILNKLKFEELNKNNLIVASKIQYEIFPNASAYFEYKSKVTGKKENFFITYLAYLMNKPIGVIGLYEIPEYKDTIWISWFGLLKEYRSMGFGKQMLNFMIELAKKKNKKFLRLYTYEIWNHEAQEFYKKNMDIGEYYINSKEKYKNLFDGKPKIFSISLCDEKVPLWNNKFIDISGDEDTHEKSILMMKKDGII